MLYLVCLASHPITVPTDKSMALSYLPSHGAVEGHSKLSPLLPLLKAEQPQVSLPLLVHCVQQPSNCFGSPLTHLLCFVNVHLKGRGQNWGHYSRWSHKC